MIESIHTDIRASEGERWMVPCDHRPEPDGSFEDWVKELSPVNHLSRRDLNLMEGAWRASRQRHTASLTRIGWLDQLGRIWKQAPPQKDFRGGSLQPLLVDNREDSP